MRQIVTRANVHNRIDMRRNVVNYARHPAADPFYVPVVIVSLNGVERIGFFTESPITQATDLALQHPEDVRRLQRAGYFARLWSALCGE